MPPPLAIAPTPAELLLRATLLARSVVTETVYDNPAPTGLTQEGPKKAGIPIAPIAGGAAGGALLACILCAAWIVWGRSIKRKEAKEKAEQVSASVPSPKTAVGHGGAPRFSLPRTAHSIY